MSIEAVAGEILNLLGNAANQEYFGEPVSQLQHALQCAQLARDAGADDETILAALLHDVGHLLDAPREVGVVHHDEIGARWLLERGFSQRVASLVAGHVDAKRYLTATNAAYAAKLSPASAATLVLQGGPMGADEATKFAVDPLFADKLRLRSWDEQGKRLDWDVTGLPSYRELLLEHLRAQS